MSDPLALSSKTRHPRGLEARGLTQQGLERILESTGDARFDGDLVERLSITRKEVVEGLATSHPTTLHLPLFYNVPGDSWERLGGSLDSERLRKVNLRAPLGLSFGESCAVPGESRGVSSLLVRAPRRCWPGWRGAES